MGNETPLRRGLVLSGVEHGTRTAYDQGCSCRPCRGAQAAYLRDFLRAKRRPEPKAAVTVAAVETRSHLLALRAAGIGTRRIAELTGVARQTILDVLQHPERRITVRTRDRLMAAMPTAQADGTLVDATETRWLVRGLLDAGWTRAELARLVHGERRRDLDIGDDRVTRRTARLIRELATDVFADVPDTETPEQFPDWSLAGLDLSWRARGACRFRPPGEDKRTTVRRFFVGRGGDIGPARQFCERCEVKSECLDFALRTNAMGIWGGTTERERSRMRARDGGTDR